VAEGSKAHRLYDPVQKRAVVSRDVIFEEATVWKWGENSENDLMEFQVENDDLNNNLGWDSPIVGNNTPLPYIDQGDFQAAGSSSSMPDELQEPQSPANYFGAGENSVAVGEQSTPDLTGGKSSDEGPRRFRSLAEIYQNTEEIVLEDSEGEALLAETE
jgi:hypothetical protein